jgi:pterin-4a-carbinolamine dehydratase
VSLDGKASEYMRENMHEGQFRSKDIEEFKPSNDALNDLKSKHLPDWEMLDHRILQAKYVAQDHREAEAFVRIINKLSEKMDHFCEVTQDVAEVTVKTTTFDVKGLTILDFQIAMVIDKFANDVGIKQVRMSGNFGMHENFADGKKPGRKGLAKRSGVNTKASVSSLRKTAKNSTGEKQRMAHWMANMKAGKKK